MLPEPAYFISGLVVGGIYAIFVLGLVLTYKSSRIFNFAQGAMAFFVAATYHSLHSEYGWSIPVAGVVAILAVAPLLGLFLWAVLFRLLTGTSETVRLVSTIGLYVALPALTVMIWGEEPFITAPGLAPTPVAVWHVFGVGINADQVAVLAAAIAIAVGMTLFLRYTTFGLQVRGAVDAPRVASLTGTNTALVSALSWMVGTTTAGLAGVLLSPIRGLDPFNFTLLLIASFAAVVIARLESLPLAFAGAMLLGLAQEISVKYIPNDAPQVIVSGLRPSIPFLIMAFFLFAYSGLGREKYARDRMPSSGRTTPEVSRAPLWRRLVAPVLVLLAVFVVVPDLVSGFWLGIVGSGIALSIIFLGQTVVTGEGGMISLCQITFAGIGAIASAQLIT
ncbi:MAG TPA: branched-chain amino acid ABC transporter permease, partial [Acidimicrobiia bacterium]|nr:branched-chain amino acid ABC transporter permease [Acidimicrobiia bacterium]